MPLTLSLARHADAKRIAEIHMAAFASNVMLHAQFPTPTIRDGLQRSVELKALADIDDAKTTVLVVRDSPQAQAHRSWQRADEDSQQQAHGQVVAFAKWAHPVVVGEEYTEPSWVWPDGTEWDILDKWTKRTEEAQQNVIGRMPCYRLHFIGTDPLYQRQGAGSLMLQWGIEQGLKDRVPVYVESTIEAAPFYKKHGFEAMETFSVDLDEASERVQTKSYAEISFLLKPSIDGDL